MRMGSHSPEQALKKLLELREAQTRATGEPPDLDTISAQFGWSSRGTAHKRVAALIAAGKLRRPAKGSRRLELCDD